MRGCARRDLLEDKLEEHGAGKVVPNADELADAYRLFVRGANAKKIADDTMAAMAHEEIAVSGDLEDSVRAYLAKHPQSSWDNAVKGMTKEAVQAIDTCG